MSHSCDSRVKTGACGLVSVTRGGHWVLMGPCVFRAPKFNKERCLCTCGAELFDIRAFDVGANLVGLKV